MFDPQPVEVAALALDVLLTNEERYNSILGWLLDPDPTRPRPPAIPFTRRPSERPIIRVDHGFKTEFLIRFLSLLDGRSPQEWRDLVLLADPLWVEPDMRVRHHYEGDEKATSKRPDFGITLGSHVVVVEVKTGSSVSAAKKQLSVGYEDLMRCGPPPESIGLVLLSPQRGGNSVEDVVDSLPMRRSSDFRRHVSWTQVGDVLGELLGDRGDGLALPVLTFLRSFHACIEERLRRKPQSVSTTRRTTKKRRSSPWTLGDAVDSLNDQELRDALEAILGLEGGGRSWVGGTGATVPSFHLDAEGGSRLFSLYLFEGADFTFHLGPTLSELAQAIGCKVVETEGKARAKFGPSVKEVGTYERLARPALRLKLDAEHVTDNVLKKIMDLCLGALGTQSEQP